MKKFLILLMVTLLMSLSVPAFAAIGINVNGQDVYSDVPAQNIGGRVMVPVRLIAEMFGANVSWDEARQTVIITTGNYQSQQSPGVGQSNSTKDAQIATVEREIERVKSDYNYSRTTVENQYQTEKARIEAALNSEIGRAASESASSGIRGSGAAVSRREHITESFNSYFEELERWYKTEIDKINEDEAYELEALESQLEELYR